MTERKPQAPDPRDTLRARIDAEILRQDVVPVARRTLGLIAEGMVEPDTAVPGYRVVDRARAPRFESAPDGSVRPSTLADLFEELRARHPALFVPRPPKPVVESPAEPTPTDDIKAATARFVETQSVLARSLTRSVMEKSASGGRAAAGAAGAAWTGLRTRLGERLQQRSEAPGSETRKSEVSGSEVSGSKVAMGERVADLRARAGTSARQAAGLVRTRLGGLATGTARAGAAMRQEGVLHSVSSRPVVMIGAGLFAVAALLLVVNGRSGGEPPASAEPVPDATAQGPTTNPAPDEASPPPAEEPGPPPKPAPAPNEISGPAEVVDTATLRIGGRSLRLFGVEWVRGGQSEELARYLGDRSVTCQPVAGSTAYLCAVDGRDLSEVVLFNGGGHASSEATPDLVAAEDRARSERLGVWAR